jgi:hypothetical protein
MRWITRKKCLEKWTIDSVSIRVKRMVKIKRIFSDEIEERYNTRTIC